jgi:hypothetical protein
MANNLAANNLAANSPADPAAKKIALRRRWPKPPGVKCNKWR